MSKKTILGLVLFGSLTIFVLFIGVNLMINQNKKPETNQNISGQTQQEAAGKGDNSADNSQAPGKTDIVRPSREKTVIPPIRR
jgi:hypothetical protein